MSDGDALLAAIIANPDDDTPRLVYADWLDENGQPERAEFIRLHVGAASPQSWPTVATAIVPPRAKQLAVDHAPEWLEPLGLVPTQVAWCRGFVEDVTTTPGGFVTIRERMFSSTPVSSLRIVSGKWGYGSLWSPRGEEALVTDSSFFTELANCPHLARIRRLGLQLPLEDNEIQVLTESPFISGLESLDLGRSGIGDGGLALIGSSPKLQNLKSLSLFDVPIDAATAMILAQAPYLQHAHLDLTCTLDDSEPDYSLAVEALTQRFGSRVFFTVRD